MFCIILCILSIPVKFVFVRIRKGTSSMIFLNGNFVEDSKAVISVTDRGFLYGDGVYETLRAYGGVLFRAAEHWARLGASAAAIGARVPYSAEELTEIATRLVRINGLTDSTVRLQVTKGPSEGSWSGSSSGPPTTVIFARPFANYPPECYREGVKVIVAGVRRNPIMAQDPRIKAISFLNNVLAKREAEGADALEAIMLNYRDEVAEGTTSNVFFVKDGKVITPPGSTGILLGVTRGIVLELAKEMGLEALEQAFQAQDLCSADEAFLTSTLKEIMPIQSVSNVSLRSPVPGPVVLKLREAYKALVEQETGCPSTL